MKKPNFFLSELHLTNFATFTKESIHFCTGFNAIIGETGSGKSLILEAIQLILGSRADRKSVRKNSEFAIIEGVFQVNDEVTKKYFDDIGYPLTDEMHVKRIIYSNGKSKSYLNHQSCTLNLLASIAKRFIDLVGQFENQKLLSSNYQLSLLDSYSKEDKLLGEYKESFDSYKELQNKFQKLSTNISQREERIEFLDFQVREFRAINPTEEEYLELKERKEAFKNKAKVENIINEANTMLYGDEEIAGLISQLSSLTKLIEQNQNILNLNSESLLEAQNLIESFEQDFQIMSSRDDEDQDIDSVIERLDSIQKLKLKYRMEINEVIEKFEGYEKELDELKNIETNLSHIGSLLSEQENKTFAIAKKLHKSRIKAAKMLGGELTEKIRDLNMKGATVDIRLSEKEMMAGDGISHVEIYAETNPGEGYYPIREIASGGELSRILLGLRQILSTQDSISVFLFDEIDTGIGGKTALKIGHALKEVSNGSQVISITHLPQIAINSDQIISVDKATTEQDGDPRTYSFIKQFEGAEIKEQSSKMAPL